MTSPHYFDTLDHGHRTLGLSDYDYEEFRDYAEEAYNGMLADGGDLCNG